MKLIRLCLIIGCIQASTIAYTQPNCTLYDGDCLKACELYLEANQYNQGTHWAQHLYDSAITLCPTFSYAHHERSVAFLKNGEFIIWMKYMEEAVKHNPREFLANRGWCRFKFLHDYKGALKDLRQSEKVNGGFLGWSGDGNYDLRIVIAICYRELGAIDSALLEFNSYFNKKQNNIESLGFGTYDYLHYGVTLLKAGKPKEAALAFEEQIKIYKELPDTYYYLATLYATQGETTKQMGHLNTAKEYYNKGYSNQDPYCELHDEIFLSEIELALKNVNK